jgi:hypothetical protein
VVCALSDSQHYKRVWSQMKTLVEKGGGGGGVYPRGPIVMVLRGVLVLIVRVVNPPPRTL